MASEAANQQETSDILNKRNVLLPIDDTQDSVHALEWTLENFYRPGDEIHLFHVVPVPQPVVIGGVGMSDAIVSAPPDPEEDKMHIEQAKAMAECRFVPLLEAAKAQYSFEVVRFLTDNDSIGEAVCKRAAAINACAVVLASHNKGKLKEFFLGSVSSHVTHHSKQAVVVLH